MKKSDRDGFENHLVNLISSKMGSQCLKFVEISVITSKDKEICRTKVYRSGSAVFLKEGIMQEFYVRTGNNSRPFSMSEAVEYIREHWK